MYDQVIGYDDDVPFEHNTVMRDISTGPSSRLGGGMKLMVVAEMLVQGGGQLLQETVV